MSARFLRRFVVSATSPPYLWVDADRVHRLVERERVESGPDGAHVLVDPLVRSDLPVGCGEPERSVHLEELIAVADAVSNKIIIK